MTQLSTNLSDPLLDLLREDPAAVDALEIGPWLPLKEITPQRQALPGMPFHFHGGNLLLKTGLPGVLHQAQEYVRLSGSPWASFHLFIWPYWMGWLLYRYRVRLPRPNPQRETRRLIWQIQQMQRALPVPVTLENIEFVPYPEFIDHVQPALIRRVLEQAGCNLLLDLGHARVAAAELGMAERDYLMQLPLERVVQLHVSGPRMKNGRLADAHETLQEEDYALLEFTLQRTHPQVVTLEFIRNKANLRAQLERLRALLSR